jgi:hypothetical protein
VGEQRQERERERDREKRENIADLASPIPQILKLRESSPAHDETKAVLEGGVGGVRTHGLQPACRPTSGREASLEALSWSERERFVIAKRQRKRQRKRQSEENEKETDMGNKSLASRGSKQT